MKNRNFKRDFTIYFIIFGIIISVFAGIIGYNINVHTMQSNMKKQADEVILVKKFAILKTTINRMNNILIALRTNPVVENFIINRNKGDKAEVENIFLAVAGVDNQLMQARFIDANGQEIIRVNRKNEQTKPYLVPYSMLQDKCNRDYFQTLSGMKSERIWHSKFDLNIEHGAIEVPYRPTIRAAIPLFSDKKFQGIIIVNLLTKKLFESIGKSSEFNEYIVDKDGNYIFHPNEIYSFNKYTKTPRLLRDDFSGDSVKVSDIKENCDDCFVYSLNDIIDNADHAVLILKVKESYYQTLLESQLKSTLSIIILSIIASFFIAFYTSMYPAKIQEALVVANIELKKFAKILDKYVLTVTTKTDGRITDVSSAFESASGYKKVELIGHPMRIVRHPETEKSLFQALWKDILSGKEWNGEIQNRKKDGSTYWLEQHIIPIKNDKSDAIDGFMSIAIDITAKKALEDLSVKDKLTGIFNRRKIDEVINYEIEVAKRHSRTLSMIFIDIDHFKRVNDTFGHQSGDAVLKKLAKIVSHNIRKSDAFGRYGGEEFIIICPETTANKAYILAEKLRQSVSDYRFDDVEHITISLGVAQLQEGDTTEMIIKKADLALYEAKNSGRDKVVIFSAPH